MDKEKRTGKSVMAAKAAKPSTATIGKKKDQKILRHGKSVQYGNYVVQLYRKALWDDGKVIDLDYLVVRAVGDHFTAEIFEHSEMFHYLSGLINDDKEGQYAPYITMLCRNIHFVSTSADGYFHNVVSLASSVSIEPRILKEGFEVGENVSNTKFMEALKDIREKWITKREEELALMEEKEAEYTDEEARADAAADICEEEMKKK